MKHLHTEIQIEADPAEVWAVLTDFDRYPDWNPFLVDVRGDAEPGATPPRHPVPSREAVASRCAPPSPSGSPGGSSSGGGTSASAASSTVGTVSSCTRTAPAPGSSSGRPSQDCWCRSWPRSLDGPTAAGFALMNEALRARAEEHHAGLRD